MMFKRLKPQMPAIYSKFEEATNTSNTETFHYRCYYHYYHYQCCLQFNLTKKIQTFYLVFSLFDQTSGNYPAHIPRRHSSETIKYYLTFAQLWLQMGFDIAGSVFTPFNVVRQAEAICRHVDDLSVKYSSLLRTNNITLGVLN